MSELIVVAYPDRYRAHEVLVELRRSEQADLVELEDAAVVSKDADGKLTLWHSQHISAASAVGGGFWGMLIGALFLAPVIGAAVGAATGALAGAVADVGFEATFVRELGEQLGPNSSALFLLVERSSPGQIVAILAPHGGTLLQTTLSSASELTLREALARHGGS